MKRGIMKQGTVLILSLVLLGGCSRETAGNYYKDGMDYFRSGNYDKAEKSLAKAIELNGDKAEYYIDYGMNMIQLGKYDEAVTYFQKAIQDKKNLIVNKNNKLALRGEGIAYLKAHKFTEAIKKFEEALAIKESDKLNLDILYYKGNAQFKAGLYKEAAASYTDIIKIKPGDSASYNVRGDIYRSLGEYEDSLADYNKAIDLDKNNYEYYFGKYFLMLDQKDSEGAKEVLKKALSIKGSTQKDKFNIAKVDYYMEDYDKAVVGFSEAYSNGFFEAYYYLGDIYERKGEYETAVNNYAMYIENQPVVDSAAVYNQIANCYIKLNKDKEALAYIEDGIEMNDIIIIKALKRNEVVVYEKLGNFEKAYSLMKKYVKEYPEDKVAKEELTFLKTRLPDAVVIQKEK
ncbi:MAG: repeat-containing protein [Anaerocolumna sp.]|jgi:tetratricopeptide (TPR) repeat protein|nr:repeat-containing protein [Anaerocolumna sp.]